MSQNTGGRRRTEHCRRSVLKALSVATVAALGSGTASAARSGRAFPDLISLPDGFQPEGIVAGRGTEFFVGSLSTGDIYRGDLRTGEGEVLTTDSDGSTAVGLSYDRRSDSLFVAGDGTGKAFVYDAESGELRSEYNLAAPSETFVNDVVVTREAAYFTDSSKPVLYKLPLGPGGSLPTQNEVSEVPLGEEFEFVDDEFNANGIDASPNGAYLIIVNSTTGSLYKVDPESGEATEIDLGGETVTAGDGILLDGKTLYVVRNRLNQIAVIELEPGAEEGELVRSITDPDFDVPTTVTEFGSSLYAVNARFGTEEPGDAEYDVVRVLKGPNA